MKYRTQLFLFILIITLAVGSQAQYTDLYRQYNIGGLTPGNITGFVYDEESGMPIVGANIFISRGNWYYEIKITDENGIFVCDELRPGEYEISASFYTHEAKMEVVELGEGQYIEIDFALTPLEGCEYGTVSGVVIDAQTQEPIPDAFVEIIRSNLMASQDYRIADENGIFIFDGIITGNIKLVASKEGYESVVLDLEVLEEPPIEVSCELNVGGYGGISGLVLDEETQEPLENISAKLVKFGYPTIYLDNTTNTTGYFGFGNVPTGLYAVKVYGSNYQEMWKEDIIVVDGETTEVIFEAVPIGGDASNGFVNGIVYDGILGDPVEEASVTLISSEGDTITITDEAGQFDFSQILPGQYIISAQKADVGYAEDDILVVEGETTEVILELIPNMSIKDFRTQNIPNPFNPTTTISFSLPKSDYVSLKIYNINGQLIKTLKEGQITAGYHTALWEGTDEKGRSVHSGVYFYKLTVGNYSFSKQMLLLK